MVFGHAGSVLLAECGLRKRPYKPDYSNSNWYVTSSFFFKHSPPPKCKAQKMKKTDQACIRSMRCLGQKKRIVSERRTRLDYTDTKTAEESHFGHFRDFRSRAAAGILPPYTFLEPDFGAGGNSQHPNYDVSLGEQLIRDVYYAVRNGPGWNETLLLITYDEHGGNYDHVPPPSGAAAPDDSIGEFDFDFTRFGVRVPSLLISPRIVPGTVFRAKTGTIDHTSVLKTITTRWRLSSLTARDKAAPSLGDVLTLASPRTDGPIQSVLPPASEPAHPHQSQPSLIEKIHSTKVSQLQLRNDRGTYDRHQPPDLSSSAAIGDYIQSRMAAWTQHLQR
jgi:phospholipase C